MASIIKAFKTASEKKLVKHWDKHLLNEKCSFILKNIQK